MDHLDRHAMLDVHCVIGALASETELVLTEGGYLGKSTEPVTAGDIVVLLVDMDLPMLLRPIPSGYTLVGPTYIHGMMFGERWYFDETEMEGYALS